MVRILSILVLFIVGCGVNTDTANNTDSILSAMSNDPSMYVIYDTVHRKYVIWDTVHRKFKIWDTVLKTIPIPIDSPYMVGVPVDSLYTVIKRVYVPMYLPEYLREAVKSGQVKFTIRYK